MGEAEEATGLGFAIIAVLEQTEEGLDYEEGDDDGAEDGVGCVV